MKNYKTITALLAAASLAFFSTLSMAGDSMTGSGFLSDYSMLEARKMTAGSDYVYIAPGTMDTLKKYRAVMIDQPEIFLSADSEYKGVKPDAIKAIADIIRGSMINALMEGGYQAVEQPGADVLYVRLALSELYLKKKKRGLLSYTPIGAVVHAGAAAMNKEALSKMDIIEMSLEAEFVDSASGDSLAAMVVKRGARKDKKMKQKEQRVSFEEFASIVADYSGRVRCRLDNAKMPESDWKDCAMAK